MPSWSGPTEDVLPWTDWFCPAGLDMYFQYSLLVDTYMKGTELNLSTTLAPHDAAVNLYPVPSWSGITIHMIATNFLLLSELC